MSILKDERKKTNIMILGLIGLALLVSVLVFFAMAWRLPIMTTSGELWLKPMELRELHQSWLDEVAKQTRGIDSRTAPQKVRQAIDALLKLKVTADDKQEHLRIVVALLALERGDSGAWSQVQSALASLPTR